MQYRAVFLDLDGTLIDSPKYWHAAYNDALQEYNLHIDDDLFRHLYPHGYHVEYWLEHIGAPRDDFTDIRAKRDKHYIEYLRTDTKWLEGAQDFLGSLKEKLPLGIITGSHREYVDMLDQSLGVSAMVDLVLATEDFSSKAHALQICSDHFSVDLVESVYIGDQPFDAEGAHKTSTPFMVYKGSYTPESMLDGTHPVITDWKKTDFLV